MICIGAIAIGFAGFRAKYEEQDWADGGLSAIKNVSGFALMLISNLLVVLRLVGPRPSLRRITSQPGSLACFAAAAYGLFFDIQYLFQMWIDIARRQERTFGGWVWWIIETPGSDFALIVPILWLLLLLGRRWRREPGWIDTTGIVVGCGWIVWWIASPYLA